MGSSPANIVTTNDFMLEMNGLWRSHRKLTMMALAWHLLRDLEARKVGTNEIEAQSIARTWNRMLKKGYGLEKPSQTRRDVGYISGLLKLRANQAKEDWYEAKMNLRVMKSRLEGMAKLQGQQ